jgi:AcrR family transcriptional regulator
MLKKSSGRPILLEAEERENGREGNARERLIEAGTALFAEKGYASTSVREIVERAGVTKPVLYYYFKNKEGMFRAILQGATENQDMLLAQVNDEPGTVQVRLGRLFRLTYEKVLDNRDLLRLIHNLVFGPPQGAPEYDLERFHRRMISAIKDIYSEGVLKGEVRDANPDEVAVLVLSILDFSLHMDHLHPESVDSERPERILRIAFQGLSGAEQLS